MLGAIIGDIVGSVYEFNNYRAKDFEPFFHAEASFTDDTVCTVAVADALINGRHPAVALRLWGMRYWDNGGWGMRFAEWLADPEMGPYGSFGNGAAMRVSPAGLLAKSIEDAIALSDRVTEVTHNHPEGMRGGAATAVAVFLARTGVAAADMVEFQCNSRVRLGHFGAGIPNFRESTQPIKIALWLQPAIGEDDHVVHIGLRVQA